ncbi:MAG: hypothetical protein LBP54_01850 [Campylobacteraceae bacterium]|jgi:hypothetical protein|nr:hypothetical protein [Campylobacteraceae bacterium]
MIRKIFLLLLFGAAVLSAHKLNLFLYDENGTLFIQSYFHKSAPCKNCEVKIEDENGVISELVTDEEGRAQAKVAQSVFSVSVDGGMGHFVKENYELKSGKSEQSSALPKDMTWQNTALGLCIMAALFFILWFVKRKK